MFPFRVIWNNNQILIQNLLWSFFFTIKEEGVFVYESLLVYTGKCWSIWSDRTYLSDNMYYRSMVKECNHQIFIHFSHKELLVNKRFPFLCHWQLKKCHVITTLLKSLNWDLILNGMLRWTRKSNVIWYPLEPKAYYSESISSFTTLKICLDEAQLHGEHQWYKFLRWRPTEHGM